MLHNGNHVQPSERQLSPDQSEVLKRQKGVAEAVQLALRTAERLGIQPVESKKSVAQSSPPEMDPAALQQAAELANHNAAVEAEELQAQQLADKREALAAVYSAHMHPEKTETTSNNVIDAADRFGQGQPDQDVAANGFGSQPGSSAVTPSNVHAKDARAAVAAALNGRAA